MSDRWCVYTGDCRAVMANMLDNSVDAVVTDPPYELGFMGKKWDASGIAYDLEVWRQALRVLKPGGHLIAFGGSRTYHRMACAVEDAGFQVRDQVLWIYGSGFPKSLNISKAIDAALGAEREVVGYKTAGMGSGKTFGMLQAEGQNITAARIIPATAPATAYDGFGTALKPSHEPAVLARKPLIGTVAQNVLAHGTGGLNIAACRIGHDLIEGKLRGNARVTSFASGGITLDAIGRWPANLIHDGSTEVLAVFPETGQSKASNRGLQHSGRHGGLAGIGGNIKQGTDCVRGHSDNGGSAARYFYTAKASRADRDDGCESLELVAPHEITGRKPGSAGQNNPRAGIQTGERRNTHPTVKPTELMRYLCRLVTPPGGTVLDPFCGSGSTGRAALLEGFNFIGIELLEDHAAIARARIACIEERGVQLEIA